MNTTTGPVHVRLETPADIPAIRALVRAAFAPDHEADGDADLEARLVDALREAGARSSVAERDGQVVGHVMCTRSLLDTTPRLVDVLALAPLAVGPEHQRSGVGRALVAHALEAATADGYPLVFVEGDWRYYGRLGFRRGDSLGFRRPSLRIPPKAFQVAVLPAHEPWMTGGLVYPDVLWRLDCVGLRGQMLTEMLELGA